MPETCRVLWQNKFWIFDASSWLFYTKLITMHGHLSMHYVFCLAVSSHLRRTSDYIYQNFNKVFLSALCMCCVLERKFVYKLKLQLCHFIFLVCFELQTELCSIAVTRTSPPFFLSSSPFDTFLCSCMA